MIKKCAYYILVFLFAVPASAQVLQEIELGFEPVEGASQYEIEVRSSSKSFKTKNLVVNDPYWKFAVPAGKYKLRSRSYDARKVPGPWSEAQAFEVTAPAVDLIYPRKKQTVLAKEDDEDDLVFKWKGFPGVDEYLLEIKGEDGFSKKETTSKSEYEVSLDVAKNYSWRVTALDGNEKPISQIPQFQKFGFYGSKLEKPEFEPIKSDLVKEVNWEKPKHSEAFSYSVQRKTKKGKWRTVKKEKGFKGTKVLFDDKWKGGDYRVAVKAHAKGRVSSDIAKLEFKAMSGKRKLAAIEKNKLRESIEKKTNLFFIASYLLTSMQYEGQNLESSINFDAVGGTGRLGLGYLFNNSNWGTYGIVDMSGFDIGGERFTFPAAELHVMHKTYLGNWKLRTSGGFFMKSLPEVTGLSGQGSSTSQVESITSMGPHVGVDFFRPITVKYGLQLSGRLYVNSTATEIPNDGELEGSSNMQVSAYGTYRLGETMMGFAGYAYRVDEASYTTINDQIDANTGSTVPAGASNSVSIGGHYINLILEYEF